MHTITIELISVILFVVLAFVCGYSAGHKVGRKEAMHMAGAFMASIKQTFEEIAKNNLKKREESKNSFLEFLNAITPMNAPTGQSSDKPKEDNLE